MFQNTNPSRGYYSKLAWEFEAASRLLKCYNNDGNIVWRTDGGTGEEAYLLDDSWLMPLDPDDETLERFEIEALEICRDLLDELALPPG